MSYNYRPIDWSQYNTFGCVSRRHQTPFVPLVSGSILGERHCSAYLQVAYRLFVPMQLVAVGVDATELVHGVRPVLFEVGDAPILGSPRTLEAVCAPVVTHDEGTIISSVVETIVVSSGTRTCRNKE